MPRELQNSQPRRGRYEWAGGMSRCRKSAHKVLAHRRLSEPNSRVKNYTSANAPPTVRRTGLKRPGNRLGCLGAKRKSAATHSQFLSNSCQCIGASSATPNILLEQAKTILSRPPSTGSMASPDASAPAPFSRTLTAASLFVLMMAASGRDCRHGSGMKRRHERGSWSRDAARNTPSPGRE